MTRGKAKGSEGLDSRLSLGIAALVAGLAALVWWSLPGEVPPQDPGPAPASGGDDDAAANGAAPITTRFERLAHASCELAVLTDKPRELVTTKATAGEASKLLDVKYCGATCDAVRKALADEDAFEIDVMTCDEYILPPPETMDTTAPGLSARERQSVHDKPTCVVVRTQGPVAVEHVPARACFSAAAALADALDGFVYDQTVRVIQTRDEVRRRVITRALGEPALSPRHIVVQHYRQPDGTARLLTLGMARFGSPDLIVRGANMGTGTRLGLVVNAVAALIAAGRSEAPFEVTLGDVARATGLRPSELHPTPDQAKPVKLFVTDAERVDGDPDNEIVELVPEDGPSRKAWEGVVASLFGSPNVVEAGRDAELVAVAERARRGLPSAIARFEAGEGQLFVKGDFPIPEELREDGGATTEGLWISVVRCDAQRCTGSPSAEPVYATNLAPGKTTSVARAEVIDWFLQLRDGGAAGGESIAVLKKRAAP